ncbi:MAG: nucleotidyltransferase domain-containing protein [Chloroflexota bacterium]|nr:nucleotidyltransferase domain-containing protein [Chloroflexota bacterium]
MQAIEGVAREIVARFDPVQVILFGSYAYGEPTADSDVDLLILMNSDRLPIQIAADISAGIDHPFALDILVYTPAQLASAVERNATFATEVVTRGVVLA